MKERDFRKRVPVIYKTTPLMPMRYGRARKYVNLGKAKFKYDKLGILYLKLLEMPSSFNTQEIVLGIDPGASYDGFSVVSKTHHHENINTEHTRNIKKRMKKRALFRRIRRTRLWHRKVRFDNRTSSKLSPTIKSKVGYRKFIIIKLSEIYPISKIVVEDVKFDHSKDKEGKHYSLCELGKTSLYNWIDLNHFDLEVFNSDLTQNLRLEIFGKDLKSKEIQKSFYSHCIDSYSIIKEYSQSIVNTKVRYVTKIWYSRRELYRDKSKFKDACKYFKYKKGEKVFFDKYSKVKKLRTKINNSKSNHGPWTYEYSEPTLCSKQFKSRYGGTIKVGQSTSKVPIGKSKYAKFKKGNLINYQHRHVEVLYGLDSFSPPAKAGGLKRRG
jgi:hypothetical protein